MGWIVDFLTSKLAGAIISIAIGTLWAYVKDHHKEHPVRSVAIVRSFAQAAIATGILWTCFVVTTFINEEKTIRTAAIEKQHADEANLLTPANASTLIHKWLDDFHFAVKSRAQPSSGPKVLFMWDVIADNGNGVTMFQNADTPKTLFITAGATPTGTLIEKLKKIDKKQIWRAKQLLRAQLISLRISFAMNDNALSSTVLTISLPITEKLTESDLIGRIYDLDGGVVLVRDSLSSAADQSMP